MTAATQHKLPLNGIQFSHKHIISLTKNKNSGIDP